MCSALWIAATLLIRAFLVAVSTSSVALAIHSSIAEPNDWAKPCFAGSCSYDFPRSKSSLGGTLIISGSPHAISDITSASGWEILECSAMRKRSDGTRLSSSHEKLYVRMVCIGDVVSCGHLYQRGAVNTLIRLPEACGMSPFARVLEASMSLNQRMLTPDEARFKKRRNQLLEVKELILDTDFSDSSLPSLGHISFAVIGLPDPRSFMQKTGFDHNASSLLQEFSQIDKNISAPLPHLHIDRSMILLNASLSCPLSTDEGYTAGSFGIEVSGDAGVDSNITLGFVATGTLLPPKIKQFSLYSGFAVDLDGAFTIEANATGIFDSGSINIFSTELPSLYIPGILSVNPSFGVLLQMKADLDVAINVDVGVNYRIDDLHLVFPPGSGVSSARSSPRDSYLKLAVLPDASSNASVEVHLSPIFNISIVAFHEIFTNVSLATDVSSILSLVLEAGSSDSVKSEGAPTIDSETGESVNEPQMGADTPGVAGCVDVLGGVSVSASSQGSFFDIWNGSEEVGILEERVELYRACFLRSVNDSTPGDQRMGVVILNDLRPAFVPLQGKASFAMACPDLSGNLVTVVDGIL